MKMLNTKEISKEDLEKIAYYLEKYKVPLVAICGGDPILHPSLINFVQLLSEHKNYPIIATNAVDVSYEYLYQLKSAGVRYLQIGIDSLRYYMVLQLVSLGKTLESLVKLRLMLKKQEPNC